MSRREGPLAIVSMITSDSGEDDAPAYNRAWIIPPGSAETFAALMTERYGQPIESVSTVGATVRAHETGDPSVYITDGDQV